MKIENEIISSVIAAVKELYGQEVPEKMVALQKTKSNFEGNLTLVVFPFLKMGKAKKEIANVRNMFLNDVEHHTGSEKLRTKIELLMLKRIPSLFKIYAKISWGGQKKKI